MCAFGDIFVSHKHLSMIDALLSSYMVKSETVKVPTKYLGAEIQKYHILGNTDLNNKEHWAMSSDKCVKCAITNVELKLAQNDQCLQTKVDTH